MYIMNANAREIVNSNFVERFTVSNKGDAVLISASYSKSDGACITLARYKDIDEAKNAMNDLFLALAGGCEYFYMPDSEKYYNEKPKKDARTKRKGGS